MSDSKKKKKKKEMNIHVKLVKGGKWITEYDDKMAYLTFIPDDKMKDWD